MAAFRALAPWTLLAIAFGAAMLFGAALPLPPNLYAALAAAALVGCVLAAVHHAEVVAHRVGEPYGTLVLAVAITVIEVALIVSLMLQGGRATAALARDTVFAAVMIILTGMLGGCLLAGAGRHHVQRFNTLGVVPALSALAAIVVLTLVLPNHTTTAAGPVYSDSQLGFVAVVSLALYGTFVLVQTVRHRDYFLPSTSADVADRDTHIDPPTRAVAIGSFVALVFALVLVVLLGKALAPSIEAAVAALGAPKAVVGVVIAAVVLMPEGLAAIRAARADRLQTSLNLALGSALASIGLTIPAVAVVSLLTGWTLTLGIDTKSTVLLVLALFTAGLSLSTGRTTVLQGMVHLVIFAVYLFTTVVP